MLGHNYSHTLSFFVLDCSLLPIFVSIIHSFLALSFFYLCVRACRFPIALFYALSISLFFFLSTAAIIRLESCVGDLRFSIILKLVISR